jgi:hypothetical protein
LRSHLQFGRHPRLEKRLSHLQKAQTDKTTGEEFPGGVRLIDNVEDNPLQIFFPQIPSEAIRLELKSNGGVGATAQLISLD